MISHRHCSLKFEGNDAGLGAGDFEDFKTISALQDESRLLVDGNLGLVDEDTHWAIVA
jgi:hypothetical protein